MPTSTENLFRQKKTKAKARKKEEQEEEDDENYQEQISILPDNISIENQQN